MGGDVLLGGLPGGGVFGSALWICAIMFREAEGPLERRRGASGCSLLAYTTRCERGGESDWFTVLSWNIPRAKKGKKLRACKPPRL